MEWPRIPVPGWPDGGGGAADELAASAARGRELAQLLDSDTPVPGVTEGALRPEIAAVAVPSTVDESNMTGDDFALTAGWGHFGQGEAVMPGQGRSSSAPTPGGARRPRRSRSHPRRDHLRHPPQRPRLLAQRPRRRLELQARRLPGAQEVALLPRAGGAGAGAVGVGGRALRGDGAAGGGVAGGDGVVRVESRLQVPKMREVHRRLIPFRKGCEVEFEVHGE